MGEANFYYFTCLKVRMSSLLTRLCRRNWNSSLTRYKIWRNVGRSRNAPRNSHCFSISRLNSLSRSLSESEGIVACPYKLVPARVAKFSSSSPSSTPPTNSALDNEVTWENLFRFNYIPVVVFLSRLKILQTGVTFILLPYVGLLCFVAKTEPAETFYGVGGLTALAATMLLIITRISQRIVMLLYVNPNRDRIRISHLTFWGQRRESYFNLSQFEPVSLKGQNWDETYLRLCLADGGDHNWYIAPKYATMDDPQALFDLLD